MCVLCIGSGNLNTETEPKERVEILFKIFETRGEGQREGGTYILFSTQSEYILRV